MAINSTSLPTARLTGRLTLSLAVLIGVFMIVPRPAAGHHLADHQPAILRDIGFDQRLTAQVPLDLQFRNAEGQTLPLRDIIQDKPVILTLTYYDCPNLCSLVLNGLVKAMRALSLKLGDAFDVITVSIDPEETPAQAASAKRQYLGRYRRPDTGTRAGWHFLTGSADAIRRLTAAVGFRYAYDAQQDQYAHSSGIVILTPTGVVSRYLYGIEYASRDLQLSLVEAADHTIGSPIDQLLLTCYHYDPLTGKYGLVIMPIIRIAGLTTVVGIGMFAGLMIRRERRGL